VIENQYTNCLLNINFNDLNKYSVLILLIQNQHWFSIFSSDSFVPRFHWTKSWFSHQESPPNGKPP